MIKRKIKHIIKSVISFLWNKKTVTIVVSLIFAFVLLILNYLWSNKSITGNEEAKFITETGIFINKFFNLNKTKKEDIDELIFINISYDKELIEVHDDLGIPQGNLDITDRKKIASFLNISNNNHKFVLLDVIFDSAHKSPNDSLLQKAFSNSKNILAPSILKKEELIFPFFDSITTGISSYKKSIYTNRFVKYRFIQEDTLKSIALKMGEIINQSNIGKKGIFYYDNDELCLNSMALNHTIKPFTKYNHEGVQNFYNLGKDLLESMSPQQIQNLVKDKILLIGDFEDRDLHRTIYGEMPGVLINYNAYLLLKDRTHIIPKILIFKLLLIYFLTFVVIFFKIDLKVGNRMLKYLKSLALVKKIVAFLLSFKIVKNSTSFLTKGLYYTLSSFLKIGMLFGFFSIFFFLVYGIHVEFIAITGIITTCVSIRNWTLTEKKNEK